MLRNIGILLKRIFNRKLLNNPLASCFLIDFLLSHTAHFHKSLIFFTYFCKLFTFCIFFLYLRQRDNIICRLKFFNKLISSSLSIASNFLRPQSMQYE